MRQVTIIDGRTEFIEYHKHDWEPVDSIPTDSDTFIVHFICHGCTEVMQKEILGSEARNDYYYNGD